MGKKARGNQRNYLDKSIFIASGTLYWIGTAGIAAKLDRCRSESAVELFTIQCTTCRARLVVHDEAVIGDILACPKCSSMVHVVPPVGWNSGMVDVAPPDPSVWPPTRQSMPTASKPMPAPEAPKTS